MRGAIMILKCVLGCTADNAVDGNPALNVTDVRLGYCWWDVGCGMTRRDGLKLSTACDEYVRRSYVHKNGGRAERER